MNRIAYHLAQASMTDWIVVSLLTAAILIMVML
jgi:hypothetical protein